ncbi:MAG: hypothetical protein HDT42_03740 [Ruminococcaceae bacterium]|nr:hypothetical protein [Oscillospiraceae bacterium]
MKFKSITAVVMSLALTASTFSANSAFNTTASAAQATHDIRRHQFDGPGTVNVSPQAAAGDTVKLTATADEGYAVYRFTVVSESGKTLINDSPCSKSKTYEFVMPDEWVYYNVIFSKSVNRPYYIYQTYYTGRGNISVDKEEGAISPGDLVTVTATPREGYKVGNVLVQYYNSQSYTPGQPKYSKTDTIPGQPNQTVYTFSMPDNDIDICVNFVEDIAPAPTPEPTPTPTPTPDPTPTLNWKKGDANCDGIVTAADATAVLKHLTGIMELSYIGSVNADMDQNGKVTAADATAILKMLVGKS